MCLLISILLFLHPPPQEMTTVGLCELDIFRFYMCLKFVVFFSFSIQLISWTVMARLCMFLRWQGFLPFLSFRRFNNILWKFIFLLVTHPLTDVGIVSKSSSLWETYSNYRSADISLRPWFSFLLLYSPNVLIYHNVKYTDILNKYFHVHYWNLTISSLMNK